MSWGLNLYRQVNIHKILMDFSCSAKIKNGTSIGVYLIHQENDMVRGKVLEASKCFDIFFKCIDDYHVKDSVEQKLENPFSEGSFDYHLYQKNMIDTYQWHYEDLIRVPDIADSEVVKLKRTIDSSNQKRTDLVELLDDLIVEFYADNAKNTDAKLNTETPAWVLDRMSILALKIYHMREQVQREADSEHTAKCQTKLEILLDQEKDLTKSFDELIDDIGNNVKIVKVYRQMKMYNDKTLNPSLYEQKN